MKKKFLSTLIASTVALSVVLGSGAIKALAAVYNTWTSSAVYVGGDRVTYNDKNYEAKWWTQGNLPDAKTANEWETPWKLLDGNEEGSTGGGGTGGETSGKGKVVYPDYSSVDVGQGIQQWPTTIFAPFVDATAWPPYSMSTEASKTKVPYYNLGFIVSQSASVCKPTWGTYYSAEEGPMNDEIKKIRKMGGDVIVSFGGAANVPLHVTAPDENVLKEQYKKFIKAYGITRIDFDIEGNWGEDTASNTRNSKAVKMLQAELKAENYNLQVWYTLPVLPTGLVPSGIKLVENAIDNGVNIAGVNLMTMDYGDWALQNPAGKMGQAGIDAITNVKSQLKSIYSSRGISKSETQLWNMIGTTPMLGVNDVETEVFGLNDAKQTLDFAKSKGVGMISMWSVNRDKAGASGISQEDNAFSNLFSPYNNTSNFKPEVPGDGSGGTSSKEWSASKEYNGGDEVTYKDKTYKAKWWTKGDVPDKAVTDPWDSPWEIIV